MTLIFRFTIIAFCVFFAIYAVRLIASGRLQLKYSLLWFVFVVFTLVCAIYPEPIFALSSFLGFQKASNFVLFIGLLFTLAIVLSLTLVVSKQTRYITDLVQENSILRHEIESIVNADEEKR